ncbi:MAG: hypothetical protein IPI81_11925 [Flavobacteriales bacterium]|nr:hypothetical protein [Flavobacteriales bacterium]
MNARSERIGFVALSLLTFAYIVLRAAWVPLIHDEAATFQTYVVTGRYLPFLAHWDAGNHLLITAMGRATYLLFGPSPLALRSFSVVCFVLYAVYVWRITRMLQVDVIRWCTMVALLLTPFVLDFFSLFRGYGPALAFLLMALFHLVRYVEVGGRRQLFATLFAMALATYASLSLLLIWCSVMAIAGWYVFTRDRKDGPVLGILLFIGVVPLVIAGLFGKGLSELGLLYFGNSSGFFDGTLRSLVLWILGIMRPLAQDIVMIVSTMLVEGLFVRALRGRSVPVILMGVILSGEIIGRVVLGEGFGVLYPIDRTAIQLVPLLILLFAFSLDRIAIGRPRLAFAAVLLLWLPVRTLMGANFDHTAYWPEEAIPGRIYELVSERQQGLERPLLIGAYRQNPRCWTYGASLRGLDLNYLNDLGFPQPTCELLLIDTVHFQPPPGFHTVYTAQHGRMNLMEAETALRDSVVRDSTWAIPSTNEEFKGLWSPDPEALQGRAWLIEVDASITSDNEPLELRLVVDAKDANGNPLHYDVINLDDQRISWKGDRLHVLRLLPSFSVPAQVTAYLWNPRQQYFAMDRVRVIIREVVP